MLLHIPQVLTPEALAECRRSLAEGAVSPWSHSSSQYYTQTLESIARYFRKSMRTPWEVPRDEIGRAHV